MLTPSSVLSPLFSAALLGVLVPGAAAAQPSPRLNLQVRNVDLTDSCVHPSFRPELKLVNWGSEPFVLTQAVVRMFFNNPRPEPLRGRVNREPVLEHG